MKPGPGGSGIKDIAKAADSHYGIPSHRQQHRQDIFKMTNNIKGLGTPPTTDQTTLRGTGKDGTTQSTPATPAPVPTGTAKAAAESVSLSSSAQALKALEEKIQKLPDVNEKKVAEIKAALASGQYSVDDLVVADKLLGFDELFN
ncbi:MAG TPA: flagellar biosynthesis anti-sigma factor FlgM [Spongiibacteraceae bacterium]|nr:flagellar biosynthesis anti-sigma factor FlgM [Spongiibacteraceae bacterium]